ncbi:MAG: hypothetical protein ABI699_14145 [Caldimonas sp.]
MRWPVLLLALGAAHAAAAAPAPGRYQARLCVATSASAPPGCGPAELAIHPAGRAELRVADVVYRLHLGPARLDVETLHGRMQIDQFSAVYEWQGDVLRFVDTDRQASYEVTVGPRSRSRR